MNNVWWGVCTPENKSPLFQRLCASLLYDIPGAAPIVSIVCFYSQSSGHLGPIDSHWTTWCSAVTWSLNSLHVQVHTTDDLSLNAVRVGTAGSLILRFCVSLQMSATSISRTRRDILPSCWQHLQLWRRRKTWGSLKSYSAKEMSMQRPAR